MKQIKTRLKLRLSDFILKPYGWYRFKRYGYNEAPIPDFIMRLHIKTRSWQGYLDYMAVKKHNKLRDLEKNEK